ncbi:ATP-binding protein [Spirillospora sp. NPDC048911]|uniref:ATP-binding protein n=1 Tax=Spirillospora sp. NPDC048911 TaxID=3364527 RepID=UPI003719A479
MGPPAPGTLTTATLLFTDLVESSSTRARLGEELADGHFGRIYQLLRRVTTAAGAVFTKSLGDGLMAVFESATAGLDAVTAVQRAIVEENERAPAPIAVRAALSVGDVRWDEDDVSGLPTVEAARLVDQADGGQVLCTELVRRLAQGRSGHEFAYVGRLPAKGLPRPLRAYELLWRNAAGERRVRPVPWLDVGHVLPFIGREREIAKLAADLAASETGPRVVILQGEPGVGKTRLASVITQRAADRRFTVLAGRCTDPARQAYEPIAAAVERLARDVPELLLRAGVDQQCGQLVRLAPSLAAPPLSLTVPTPTEPVSERYQLAAAVRTFLERLASVGPILLVIDDLQWATPESLAMVRALIWESEGLPLLILATSRPVPADAADPAAAELHRLEAESRVIQVEPFGVHDVSAALTAVADPSGRAAEGDPARLHTITGGNAFLVSEVIRELIRGRDLDRLTVPDSVTRMVVARLARLGPDARHLANLLAVGEQLGSAALRLALGTDEMSFVDTVEEVMATGLVTMTASGECQFSHELTRSAAYQTLSRPRVGLLHGRVADALRRSDPMVMETRPYVIAAHLLATARQGHDPARVAEAAEAAGLAARQALARLAHQEAVSWCWRRLELLDEDPGTSAERRAEALVECGRAMWLAGDPAARPALAKAAALAEESGRTDLVVAAAVAEDRGFFSMTATVDDRRVALLSRARALVDPDDLRTRALLAAQLAAELTWAQDGDDRRFSLADEAIALARQATDPATLVRVLGLRSLTVIPAESLERRAEDGNEMVRAALRTGDDLALFHATFQRIPSLLESGDMSQVTAHLKESERLARQLAQPQLVWLVVMCRTSMTLFQGDIPGAERTTVEAFELGTGLGRRLEALAFHAEQLSEIRRFQGRLGELRGRLRHASESPQIDPVHAVLRFLCELDDPEAGPALDRVLAAQHGVMPHRDLAQRPALDNLAYAASRLGRDDLLWPLYDALTPFGETFGMSAVGHHCGHHYLAHLSVARGHPGRANDHFAAAAEVHGHCGAPLLMAESLLDWADLVERGDTAGHTEPVPSATDLRKRSAGLIAGRGAVLLERRLEQHGMR